MEGNSAFYNLKNKENMKNFNALLDVLQQFVIAVCGVYFNESEKTVFVVRPWTGDSELGLFKTLYFNEGASQMHVIVEEFSSESFIKEGEDSRISYNTLTNEFQLLDLEANRGDLDDFSKRLNASRKLWTFEEYQELLKNFLYEERFDFSTYAISENLETAFFPNKSVTVGLDDEERIFKFHIFNRDFRERGTAVENTATQEKELMKIASRFLRVLLSSVIEETVE